MWVTQRSAYRHAVAKEPELFSYVNLKLNGLRGGDISVCFNVVRQCLIFIALKTMI